MRQPNNSKRILLLVALATATFAQQLGKRSEFDVPLTKMTLGIDEQTDRFKRVRVVIDEDKEYAVITRLHDMLVKNTRMGTEKTHYQESPDRAFIISKFEAEQISRTVRGFVLTLDVFEKDLKRQRWDRCLYLDAFFPRFLKRFYYLVCAARNSPHAMPWVARIPDNEYDVSLNSPKSDKRIAMWQNQPDYTIKLRIISKELSYQMRLWQKKELDNPNRNMEVAYSAKAEEAYGLFVRMYFNRRPPPPVPGEGEHL